jgi:hypothetical protein
MLHVLDEMVIRLQFFDAYCITTEEYEAMIKELQARQWAGDITPGDRVLASVLNDASYRYHEIMEIRRRRSG